MRHIQTQSFIGKTAWERLPVAVLDGTSVNVHWTNQPYHWHINDGQEVFAVLDGIVDMHVRHNGEETVVVLQQGDVFYAEAGLEHVAHPRGQARVLVVEKDGSI